MKPSVYLSLTTSPTRIQYISKMLQKIETKHFEKIVINIPNRYGKDQSTYTIPKELTRRKTIYINRIQNDYGPISKILPTLAICKNSNDIIISIDDDIKHDTQIFPILIKYCLQNDVVVTGIGKNLSYWSSAKYGKMPRFFPFDHKPTGNYVDLIEGFSGVAYKKKFFPDIELLERLSKVAKDCYLSDDLVISFYLKLFGRRILSLHKMNIYGYEFSHTKYKLSEYPWGLSENALHKGGGMNEKQDNVNVNKIKYPKCYSMLRTYYRKNKGRINDIIMQNWHHDFDKIYIINMKNKPERKKQSLKILKMLKVPSSKIKIMSATIPSRGVNGLIKDMRKLGFGGKTIHQYLGPKRVMNLKWHEKRMNMSAESKKYHKKILVELAVSISQMRVMKAGADDQETVLMLEDDFGPTKQFYSIDSHRLHMQTNWKTLYLGDCSSMRSGSTKIVKIGKENKLIQRHTVCHHAIAFRPSMGDRLLKKQPIIPFNYAINDELGFYLGKNNVPFAIYDKPLMIQDVILGTQSDIQEQNKLQWELEESNKFGVLNLRKL